MENGILVTEKELEKMGFSPQYFSQWIRPRPPVIHYLVADYKNQALLLIPTHWWMGMGARSVVMVDRRTGTPFSYRQNCFFREEEKQSIEIQVNRTSSFISWPGVVKVASKEYPRHSLVLPLSPNPWEYTGYSLDLSLSPKKYGLSTSEGTYHITVQIPGRPDQTQTIARDNDKTVVFDFR